jgi:hypothetical protein
MERAQAAYTASDWKTAAEAYATLAKRTPDQPMPHFPARRLPDQPESARPRQSRISKPRRSWGRRSSRHPTVSHKWKRSRGTRTRRSSSSSGRRSRGRTVQNFTPTAIPSSPSQGRSTLQGLLTAMDRNAHPCMYDPHSKEFDFWLGDWDVRRGNNPAAPPSRTPSPRSTMAAWCWSRMSREATPGRASTCATRQSGNGTRPGSTRPAAAVYYGEARNGNMYYEGEMPDPNAPGPSGSGLVSRFFRSEPTRCGSSRSRPAMMERRGS